MNELSPGEKVSDKERLSLRLLNKVLDVGEYLVSLADENRYKSAVRVESVGASFSDIYISTEDAERELAELLELERS